MRQTVYIGKPHCAPYAVWRDQKLNLYCTEYIKRDLEFMSLLSNDEFVEFNYTDQCGYGNWVNDLERFVRNKSSCKFLYQVLVNVTI